MNIEEYLDNLIDKYKTKIDKHSNVFSVNSFNVESVCTLSVDEKKWFKDNYAGTQKVYIPVKANGQRTRDQGDPKVKYLQIENGLYISPQLFNYLHLYEAKARRDVFPTIL
jgi:hypothetical protein